MSSGVTRRSEKRHIPKDTGGLGVDKRHPGTAMTSVGRNTAEKDARSRPGDSSPAERAEGSG